VEVKPGTRGHSDPPNPLIAESYGHRACSSLATNIERDTSMSPDEPRLLPPITGVASPLNPSTYGLLVYGYARSL
jgi:hypothetical protein